MQVGRVKIAFVTNRDFSHVDAILPKIYIHLPLSSALYTDGLSEGQLSLQQLNETEAEKVQFVEIFSTTSVFCTSVNGLIILMSH